MTPDSLSETQVSFTLNGRPVSARVEPRTSLADALREDLLATGTHVGCEQGVCGACTVFVDGRPTRSCITIASACEGAEVRTVEGFEDDALMARIRDAFKRHHGLQCGFCTPGMLTTAYDIVRRLPDADEARIRRELSGNLCRCTGYAGIVAAIQDVLANEPPAPDVVPLARTRRLAPTGLEPAKAAVSRQAETPADAVAIDEAAFDEAALADGVRLSRTATVAAEADKVWAVLTDLPSVAACIPGAALEGPVENGVASGKVVVAMGPIKAAFRGRAATRFDAASRTGHVVGEGRDGLSRSRLAGSLDFRLEPAGAGQSALTIDMVYKLKGPLAQFGRPALVEEVADRLLKDTVESLAARAGGSPLASSARSELDGFSLIATVVRSLLKRLFGRR